MIGKISWLFHTFILSLFLTNKIPRQIPKESLTRDWLYVNLWLIIQWELCSILTLRLILLLSSPSIFGTCYEHPFLSSSFALGLSLRTWFIVWALWCVCVCKLEKCVNSVSYMRIGRFNSDHSPRHTHLPSLKHRHTNPTSCHCLVILQVMNQLLRGYVISGGTVWWILPACVHTSFWKSILNLLYAPMLE